MFDFTDDTAGRASRSSPTFPKSSVPRLADRRSTATSSPPVTTSRGGVTSKPGNRTKRPPLAVQYDGDPATRLISSPAVPRGAQSLPAQEPHPRDVSRAFGLGACLVFSWWLSGYLLGLVQGIFVSLLATALLCAFHASTGSIWQMAGAWGEDSTTDELRKAKRRGLIWGFVNGVATSTGDVDHVVVTKRGGIVAVDSKYHAQLRSDTVQRDLVSAAASARRARLIMLSFGRRLEIAPVAVVWGGAQHLLGPEHKSLGNVVGGRELVPWLRSLGGAQDR